MLAQLAMPELGPRIQQHAPLDLASTLESQCVASTSRRRKSKRARGWAERELARSFVESDPPLGSGVRPKDRAEAPHRLRRRKGARAKRQGISSGASFALGRVSLSGSPSGALEACEQAR